MHCYYEIKILIKMPGDISYIVFHKTITSKILKYVSHGIKELKQANIKKWIEVPRLNYCTLMLL